MADLTGKVALVTGAGRYRGLGRAIALRLAEDGADLVVTGLHREPHEQPEGEQASGWTGVNSLAEEIQAMGRRAVAVECDLTEKASVEGLVQSGLDKFGYIDIVVNNAGVPSGAGDASVLDMDDELWYRTVDVNLNSIYLITKIAGRAMRERDQGGSIINISSTAGRRGIPDYGAYCATKFAVIGLTQQCAMEMAQYDIRVNCIAPGSHSTDMMDGTIGRTAAKVGVSTEQVAAGIRSSAPMQRQGQPTELAASVSFLAGADASFVTGQTLNVNGGQFMS
jgi:NAD(P)-dependent dehydrogenase (short-subunit alcohol dehydrogenase family)